MTGPAIHHGSCLCGAVAFEATGPLRDIIACHCSQCRKTSGHVWAATSVPLDRLRITADAGLGWFQSSAEARRGFCRTCGSSVFWRPAAEERMAIAAGAFDGDPGFRLIRHIFTADAGDYYRPEGPPPPPDPLAPAPLDCSCLCGGVAFRLPGPAGAITACHCHQCRKTSGHHAASLDADEGRLHYLRRATLAEYASPGGARRGFCAGCGSSLWFRAANGDFSVEAGSVDGPTGGWLAAHIFTADMGEYYVVVDGIPQAPGW